MRNIKAIRNPISSEVRSHDQFIHSFFRHSLRFSFSIFHLDKCILIHSILAVTDRDGQHGKAKDVGGQAGQHDVDQRPAAGPVGQHLRPTSRPGALSTTTSLCFVEFCFLPICGVAAKAGIECRRDRSAA